MRTFRPFALLVATLHLIRLGPWRWLGRVAGALHRLIVASGAVIDAGYPGAIQSDRLEPVRKWVNH